MIGAIIYDLDNTLFDTHAQLGERAKRSVLEVLRREGTDDRTIARLERHLLDTSLITLMREADLPCKVRDALLDATSRIDLDGITPCDDIDAIDALPGKRLLVTTGVRSFQHEKIRRLGLEHRFDAIRIDESADWHGKERIFDALRRRYRLAADEVLVVGDNLDSEGRAAEALGMRFVQIIRTRTPQRRAQHTIRTLYELHRLLDEVAA